MLRFILTVCLVALAAASVVKRDTGDECYRCSNFDSLGQGFIAADDNIPPLNCGHYKECWKSMGTGQIVSLDRWCAPGTMTDPTMFDVQRGAPCSQFCDPAICDCPLVTVSTPIIYECPYVQLSPQWLFGMWYGTDLREVGTCGIDGYFNDTTDVCTCTVMKVDCTCKISLPLTQDIETHGCNGGWVGQLGMPDLVEIVGGHGQFQGWNDQTDNGGHLGTYVIDGLFAGAWVSTLQWTAVFRLDDSFANVPMGTRWCIVTYTDCAAGVAFGFYVLRNQEGIVLKAELELLTDTGIHKFSMQSPARAPELVVDKFYYVYSSYDRDADPSWILYVMPQVNYNQCAQDQNNCPNPVITSNPKGTITPRGCGFIVGFDGSNDETKFFKGDIGLVSVDIGSIFRITPCT